MVDNDAAIIGAPAFRRLAGILSKPVALSTFRLFIIFAIDPGFVNCSEKLILVFK